MSELVGNNIAGDILEALYDAWERHTVFSLNSVQEQGGWEKSAFRTVVDKLEKRYRLIKNHGSSYTFDITPDGIHYAEENDIIPKDKATWHKNIRQHILTFLAELYDRDGNRVHAHYQKIAEGAPVTNSIEILRDLSLLVDLGYVQKEIRYALDVSDEQPEGTIFLIPLKIEECEVPQRLQNRHWVKLFEQDGFERLMNALRRRAEEIGVNLIGETRAKKTTPERVNNFV